MPQESYEFILVPAAGRRVRTFQATKRSVRRFCVLVGVLATLGVAVVAHYAWLATVAFRDRELAEENRNLRAKAAAYEQGRAALEARVAALQRTVTRLSVATGIERDLPGDAPPGVGGVSGRDVVSPGSSFFPRMERRIASLAERSTRLERLYRDQKEILDATPSIWPIHGYLSAGFGNRVDPFTGDVDFHPGVDISEPMGARVAAPADGTVISCGLNGGYGNNVVIGHGHDVTTRYAHLSRFNVTPGQHVRRGDIIGFVGSTGRSTGPHLHYEVWLKDRPENPLHYIIEEYKSFD